MQTYRPRLGHLIIDECRALVDLAAKTNDAARMVFNDITIDATKDSDPGALARYYHEEIDRQHEEYLASDLYKQRQAEAAAEEDRRAEKFRAAMADVETRGVHSLTLSDPEAWAKTADANPDGYGGAVIRYAETWGRLMEARLLAGQSIADCAEETSRIADSEGITGFQYGAAASMLCQWWAHGEALRAWRDSKGPCY